jgi:tetraacyldisaccharide 4'-kinase
MSAPAPSRSATWLEIVSGRRTGIGASVCRAGLAALTPFYAGVISLRNRLYDWQLLRSHRVPARVISVGNLTAGGTGKTPTVAWIVRTLQELGQRPAIISRGYAGQGGANDEKLVLDQLLPGVPHCLNPDRVAAARELLGAARQEPRPPESRPTHLVLDDAFQHRRIARDVDLVLIDALNPWGYDALLPRGLLREPVHALRRASAILITRSDLIDEATRQTLARRIRAATEAPILWSRFEPTRLRNAAGQTLSLLDAREQRWAAFCGIGNPHGFCRTLTSCGLAVSDDRFRAFPDHYLYQPGDLDELGRWGQKLGATGLLATHKDLVKIPPPALGGLPLWALEIELRLESDQAERLAELVTKS